MKDTLAKRMTIWAVAAGLLAFAALSHAQNAWYYGKISRIYMFTDGFVLTMESTALNDCQYRYVYFRDSLLGEKVVNRAYSMALTAQSSGKTFGAVIDKAINGPGGRCNSTGSADIKD